MVNYFYVENAYVGENTLTLNSSYGMETVEYTTTPDVESSWTTVTFDTPQKTIDIPQSSKVYLRGTNQTLGSMNNNSPIISCSQSFNVGGDLTSLLVPEGNVLDLTGRNEVFDKLFAFSNIVDASKLILPATTLADGCYTNMFKGCTSLTQTPELPATRLAKGCYNSMFAGCTSLTQAPELPATQLADKCYFAMYGNCKSLTQAPELPTTALAPYCYSYMFNGCTSLTQAPELPATTLADGCYGGMFTYCTSLTAAPDLPATTLAPECYGWMFAGCTKLNKVTALFTDNSARDCLYGWLDGITTTGTFYHNPDAPENVVKSTPIPATWSPKPYVAPKPINYFYVENAYAGENTLTLNSRYGMTNVEYATDPLGVWTTVTFDTPQKTIDISQSGKVYLRGTNQTLSSRNNYHSTIISCSQSFNVGGDLTTLLVPEGNVPDLTDYAFNYLFYNTKLVNASKLILPATKLASYCYRQMFWGCESLTQAPELPATTLADYCYYYMFNGCTSLQTAPALPATTLAEGCYNGMFQGCTSLITAPELPVTELAGICYGDMFRDCTSLVTAPELPATKLTSFCYQSMFWGCTKLNKITALFTDNSAQGCLDRWLDGITTTGTFYHNPDAPENVVKSTPIPATWSPKPYVAPKPINYFYVENAFNGENTLTLNSAWGMTNVEYRINDGSWTTVTFDTSTKKATINIPQSSKVYLRGTNQTLSSENNNSPIISCSQSFNVGGDLTTLLVPEGNVLDLTGRGYVFSHLFHNSKVVDASKLILPATTLADGCYTNMFKGCTPLTQTPELPATRLAKGCYNSMFAGCTSLTQAPELPATRLASSCYIRMFTYCTSLTTAPELPATTLALYCYYGMFEVCTSLTQAPELPATTLVDWCYGWMFDGCTSLTQAPDLPATTLAYECYSYMFYRCKSLTAAPDLPATTLADGCYMSMFYGCTKLNKVTALFTDNSALDCLYGWLNNVAPTGTFIHHPDLDAPLPNSYIPSGWFSENPNPEYFKLNSVEENQLTFEGSHNIEYSRDGKAWTTYTTPVTFIGDLYLRGQNESIASTTGTIKCTKPFSTDSDITTMLNILGGKSLEDGTFNNVFKDCDIKEASVKGSNLTNRAQTYVYDGAHVETVTLKILNKDNVTYSIWTGNIGPEGKLINLRRVGLAS